MELWPMDEGESHISSAGHKILLSIFYPGTIKDRSVKIRTDSHSLRHLSGHSGSHLDHLYQYNHLKKFHKKQWFILIPRYLINSRFFRQISSSTKPGTIRKSQFCGLTLDFVNNPILFNQLLPRPEVFYNLQIYTSYKFCHWFFIFVNPNLVLSAYACFIPSLLPTCQGVRIDIGNTIITESRCNQSGHSGQQCGLTHLQFIQT